MRRLLVGVGLAFAAVGPLAGQSVEARTFDRLKELVGEWEATYPDGERVTVVYELVSGGTAVMERVIGREHGESGMLSIFHLVGGRLGVSHFCTAGNQPRFAAAAFRGDTVRFALVPTSLDQATEGHIHEIEFRFGDSTHLETSWWWFEGGRPSHSLVRKQRRQR